MRVSGTDETTELPPNAHKGFLIAGLCWSEPWRCFQIGGSRTQCDIDCVRRGCGHGKRWPRLGSDPDRFRLKPLGEGSFKARLRSKLHLPAEFDHTVRGNAEEFGRGERVAMHGFEQLAAKRAHPRICPGTIVTRPTKNDVSIMSKCRPCSPQRRSTRGIFGLCMKP